MDMDYSKVYENLLMAHAFLPYYLGNGRAFSPIRVQIELTGKCNLNCQLCFQGEAYRKGENELSFAEIIRIIDQVPRYTLLTLSGGEPLIKESITDILDYALTKHHCNIITNGVLLNEDIVKLIINKRLVLLNVSVDGTGNIHDELRGVNGTFDKVKENLLLLKEYKEKTKSKFPLIDIKTLINMKNIPQLEDLYQFCETVGADFLTLSLIKNNDIQFNGSILYDDLNSNIFYKEYSITNYINLQQLITMLKRLDKIKRKVKIRYYPRFKNYKLIEGCYDKIEAGKNFYYSPCYEPWAGFQVNAQGKVYPCLAYCAGDVRRDNLKDIWNSKPFIEFRTRLKKLKLFPACAGCCYLKIRSKK